MDDDAETECGQEPTFDDELPIGVRMMTIVHLIGPGGAGKTSVGACLSQQLGWQFVDLDERFMSCEGGIDAVIEASGYLGYTRRNVAVYSEARRALAGPAVFALSSGFLLYPDGVDEGYALLRHSIESDALTALLLPAFELDLCVEIIVRRQLSRPYLRGDRDSEERKIRERFPKFMAMPCDRFRSDVAPDEIASQIAQSVRGRIGIFERVEETKAPCVRNHPSS